MKPTPSDLFSSWSVAKAPVLGSEAGEARFRSSEGTLASGAVLCLSESDFGDDAVFMSCASSAAV